MSPTGPLRLVLPAALALVACGPRTPPTAPAEESAAEEGAAEEGVAEEGAAEAAEEGAGAAPTAADAGLPAAARAMVDAHNRYRARHCAPPLRWSPAIAQVAQAWADRLAAEGCAFRHSDGGGYGENLAAGTTGAMPPDRVVAMWYDEVADYDFARPGFSMKTGHFTQVVWRGTSELGCGVTSCKGLDVWVCNYGPPGNVGSQYPEHVLPTTCAK